MEKNESPKIVTMMRIKNEERWIKKSLDSVSEFSEEIVILDDGSTDDTLKICKNHEKVVDIYCQKNIEFDEVRDKNILLKLSLKRHPDFLFSLDGDEIVQPQSREVLFEELNVIYPDGPLFAFQFLNIWDKPNQYRCDSHFNNIWYNRMIRLSKQPNDLHFTNTKFPKNSHCPGVPQNSIGLSSPIRSKIKIFHYGKFDKKLRQQKFEFLNKLDPNNIDFDGYRHAYGEGNFSGTNGIECKLVPPSLFVEIE